MSIYGETPPTGEDNSPQRLIPLGEEAVMKGLLNSLGGGNKAWEKSLRRFASKTQIREALDSKSLTMIMAALVGEDDWAKRYASTNRLSYISGGAIYYSCLVQQSRLKGLQVPNINIDDRAYWLSGQIPGFEQVLIDLQQEDFDDPEPLRAYVKAIGERFEVFETATEPDFCRVLDREIGYPYEVLSDMKLGAMDLHYLFRAHYEREELQEHLSM